ncbi:hypothetical protein ElyMa_001104000, partial [Elysia marginata]
VLLPKEWFKTLPSEDHVWLSKSIFDEGGKLRSQLQLWYHPPKIPLVFSQPPASPNLFFHHRFFLWMPYRMWNARFLCSQPGCEGQRLNSCGIYRTVRRLIDRVDDYYMGTEYLECGKYQCALGKFAAQFVSRPVSAAKALPPYRPVPTARWLLVVYVSDVHSRLDVLKAKVTFTFGTILNMGSNKRVVKKLAGEAAGTAAWSMNVGLLRQVHTEARNLFPKWKYLVVRLDIWHFMRRLASCVSSESAGAVNFQAYLLEGLVRWNEDRHAAAVVEHKKVHDYQLQCDVVAVATKLGVEPVVKPIHPTPYTDEGEEEEEAVPEVFEEEELEVEEAVDHTIPPPPAASDDDDDDASSSTIIRISPPQLMEAPEAERHEESPRSEMVLDEPTRCADIVRILRPFSLLLTKVQVYTMLIFMFRGYGSRAQSPSLSRLVEGMISLLTDLHLAEERTRGGRKDRWSGVLLNYERIRRLVLSNRELVRHTMIQLFEVNTQNLRQ